MMGLLMKNSILKYIAVSVYIALGAACVAQKAAERQPDVATQELSKGVGCLVSQDWIKDDLREIGLHPGESIGVRFEIGSVPGISPATPNNTNVLFLSPNGKRGWLLFFRQEQDGTMTVIGNGYKTTNTKGSWSASEGNGGIATYKAISSYVTQLSKKPKVWFPFEPSSSGCHSE